MCFGETEWQTHSLIEKQIQVNLLGTIRLTKEFLPLVRRSKGRIINVTSHCAFKVSEKTSLNGKCIFYQYHLIVGPSNSANLWSN